MQNRSETWIENQAEVLSAPTELVAIVESQEPVPGSDPISRRWIFGNQQTINNLVEARLEFPFDPTRTTLPIQSSTLKIENATNYDEGLPPVPDYDFSQPANMEALGFPTTIDGDLGFRYANDSVELLTAFRHSLIDANIDDFDTYVTLNGESFLSQLDKGTFYGGRYAATGIDAATLVEEILSDVAFKGEGGWNYLIGSPNCTVSTTLPLWRNSGFDYWVIDPELARFKVYIPIPPVSHREALQYVASYVGADVWVNRDGQIIVSRGLYSGDAPEYILDIGRVYERPKRIRPLAIGAVESKIMQYNYEATASEIANVSVVVPPGDLGETKAYRLTHDACHEGSLTLTGATLVGTPHYYTYSTEFLASTTNATFTAVLTGKKVSLVERAVTFPFIEGGTTATYSNPIASDETYLRSAIHEYVRMATSPQYEISMRDDPAIDNGDRLMLEQVQSTEPTPVVVANISREMTGALDATYQIYENRNRYVEDFSALDDNDSVIGYDGWVASDPSANAVKRTIGGIPLIEVSTPDVTISRKLDLRLGTPLHFKLGASVYAYATLRDLIGTMVARLRLTDTTIDRDNGSTWIPLATDLIPESLHDIVIDTHLWTISIDGGTPIEFEPLTLPVYPIGELSFEMVDGTKMWFGQIRYY